MPVVAPAVLTVYVGPPRGGCYDRLQRLTAGLAKRGADVHFVGREPMTAAGIRFHPVPGLRVSERLTSEALYKAGRFAASVAGRERIDSLFCFGTVYAAMLSPRRLRSATRLVTFVRGDVVQEARSAGASMGRVMLVSAADRVGRFASHRLVAASRHLLGNAPGLVLSNEAPPPATRTAVAQARSAFGLPSGVPLVGYAGAVVPVKGLEALIDAVAAVRGAHLSILGFGEPASPYEGEVSARAEARLGERWHPRRWSSDPGTFLDALDVFVLPSRSEGSSNVLLEALGRGVPCLGARTPGIVESLADDDLLFPEGDAGTLTEAIRALVDEPERRCRFAGIGMTRASELRFDWDAAAFDALDGGLDRRLSSGLT